MASSQEESRFVAIILAGGFGTRLWPLSREDRPKQFLALAGERSLFQQTIDRLCGLNRPAGFSRVIVVGGQGHAGLIREQCDHPGIEFDVLFEPAARNTGPAVAAALAHLSQSVGEATVAVLAADHHIATPDRFLCDLAIAREAAKDSAVVTFGIVPDHPNTGYGYIRFQKGDGKVARIVGFEEKPPLEVAKAYLAAGDCYWNSGMFVFDAGRMIEEFERHAPQIWHWANKAAASASEVDGGRLLDAAAFMQCEALPFDKAVMERTHSGKVVRADFSWSDLGAWPSIREAASLDEKGNSAAAGDWLVDASNILRRGGERKLAAIGVKDLVIVETPDVLLVADAARSQDLRLFVERARKEEPQLARQSDDARAMRLKARRNREAAARLLAEEAARTPPGQLAEEAATPFVHAEMAEVPAGSPQALAKGLRLLNLFRDTGLTAIAQQAVLIASRFVETGYDNENWMPLDWPADAVREGQYGWADFLAAAAPGEAAIMAVANRLAAAAEAAIPPCPAADGSASTAASRVRALSRLGRHGSPALEEAVATLVPLAASCQPAARDALSVYLETAPAA